MPATSGDRIPAPGAPGGVCGCEVGLYALGLEGELAGEELGYGEDARLPGASLIKVLVLAELLRRADAGLSLSETITVGGRDLVADSEMVAALGPGARPALGWLAEAMITVSDNTATNLLIGRLGETRINALARDLGLHGTVLARRMMDFEARARGAENLTTARDMSRLLAALHGGSLLSPGSRGRALDLLCGQRRPPGLPMNLPEGARVAYKPGDLPDVRNCAGIVLLPGRSFAMTVLVHGDLRAASPAVDAATREVRAHFSRTGTEHPGPAEPDNPGPPR